MTINRKVIADALHFNAATIIGASGFEAASDGTFTLDQNLSSQKLVIPLPGLRSGKKIVDFSVQGALGATTGNATVVDADLRKVTKGAGAVTDASVGAITRVSVEADTALDSTKEIGTIIEDDYYYYILVTATTANNAANDVAITGAEVKII